VGDRYQVRIELSFASGHRLLGHQGKCIHPHGHTYRAEIWMASEALNSIGFVVDFTDVKDKVDGWIDEHWDHAFLVSGRDEEMLTALRGVKGSRVFVFSDDNPSAEVMARELYRAAEGLCGVAPSRVRVWESPTQYAEYGAV
jgi:6-pyruvoyltetrahydropterin/6-carboxytetrahydropterin synthase